MFEHICNICQVNLEPCHNFCFFKLTGYQSFIHHKQPTGQTSFALAMNHFHFTPHHDFFAKRAKTKPIDFLLKHLILEHVPLFVDLQGVLFEKLQK